VCGTAPVLSSRRPNAETTPTEGTFIPTRMNTLWYGIGRFLQETFDVLLVTFGWTPVVIFSVAIGVGLVYWMYCQVKYTERAKGKGDLI
jgi:hypothetical protein